MVTSDILIAANSSDYPRSQFFWSFIVIAFGSADYPTCIHINRYIWLALWYDNADFTILYEICTTYIKNPFSVSLVDLST